MSRESPTALNLSEGKCRFGDGFVAFMESDNIPDRDCDEVLGKITRDPITIDPISGVPTLFGDWLTVRPDYVNQSSLEYQGIDWNWNKRFETENVGDFTSTYFHLIS